MQVSHESADQTDARLRSVWTRSRVARLPGTYAYTEFDTPGFPRAADHEALALVRDGDHWSQLAASRDEGAEHFVVFSIHFPAAVDNSGFVGWLATLLKARHGTGVVVICGQNSADGGIFDYWAIPFDLADTIQATFDQLNHGE